MVYLLAALSVAIISVVLMTLRYRLNSNPAKSVDSFHRAIQALKPDRKPRDRLQ